MTRKEYKNIRISEYQKMIARTVVLLLAFAVLFYSPCVFADGAKGYTIDLETLKKRAQEGIKKAREAIKEKEIRERAEKKEAEARGHFDKAQEFFDRGDYKKAILEWE